MNQPPGNPPRRGPVVRQLGRPDHPSANPQNVASALLGSVVQSPTTGFQMDPQVFRNAPPWVIALLNSVQNCIAQTSAIELALKRRGVLTDVELQEAVILISQAAADQFGAIVQSVQRQMAQEMGDVPVDPRSSPT